MYWKKCTLLKHMVKPKFHIVNSTTWKFSFAWHLKLIPYPHATETETSVGKRGVELNPVLHSQAGGEIRYRGKVQEEM